MGVQRSRDRRRASFDYRGDKQFMREQKYRFKGELRTVNEIREFQDAGEHRPYVYSKDKICVAAINEISLQKLLNGVN